MGIRLSIIASIIALFFVEGFLRAYEKTNSKQSYRQLYQQAIKGLPQRVADNHMTADSFNIFYIGESTMEGEPFPNAIPILIEESLEKTLSNKPIHWINLGMSGVDSDYWSALATHILENSTLYHPSLLVIYGGHNEFLTFHSGWGVDMSFTYAKQLNWITTHLRIAKLIAKSLGIYKLEIDDRAFFDTPIVTDEVRKNVFQNFENRLTAISQKAQEKNIPLIISTAASNISEFYPNRSICDTDSSTKTTFTSLLEEAQAHENNHLYEQAIERYQKAQLLCPTFSYLSFRMGQAYEAMGLFETAWDSYYDAIDFDGMPIRATSEQNSAIRGLAAYTMTYVADSVIALKNASPRGLIGFNQMIDGHHPNLQGYITIADTITKKIITLTGSNITPTPITVVKAETLLMPSVQHAYDVFSTRGLWFLRLATWTYEPTILLTKAREYLGKANKLSPTNPKGYVLLAAVEYLDGDVALGDRYIQMAKDISEKETLSLMHQPWFFQIKKRAATKQTIRVTPSPSTKESGK